MIKDFNKFPHVFSPIKVGNLTLKNRIHFTPMVCCLTSSTGEVTNEYLEFIGQQARTGAALVSIGATPVDWETGADFYGELDVTSDAKVGGLARLAEEVHRYGAKLSVELVHAGRGAAPYLLKTPYAIAPTPFPTPDGCRYVKEMDQHDIDHIIEAYADCAERCKKAGFDMVMIHCAHGNLLAQFLSSYSNHRNDIYGGSLENRMRFPLEVIHAVREQVGKDFTLEMRISGDEIVPGGQKMDEVLEFLKVAQKEIDLVQLSVGQIVDPNYFFYVLPPYYHPHNHNVKYAEEAKKVLDIPVSTVGSINSIADAEEIIASGKADVVGMARQLLADPETLKKAYRGDEDKTRPCLRCLEGCSATSSSQLGKHMRCSVNPVAGREYRYKVIYPALQKKKVVVVGGGPAGMMAAQTLRQRGHEVVLFEKSDRLGGLLPDISATASFKGDLRHYAQWDAKTTMECGAIIHLNTEATPELIEREDPDAVFIATGSTPIVPEIPGIHGENVVSVLDVDAGRVKTGKNVVVCGGGISGMECALALAMDHGCNVTVVDMIPEEKFAGGMWIFPRNMLLSLLKQHNVKLIGNSKVEHITPSGVQIIDRDWKRTTLEADTVVAAFGMKPNRAPVEALGCLVPETYVVGDCYEVKTITQANHSAFNYAVEV